ncbi:NupC/NupG family nucleoside CNT transporter [Parabacteroides pacaensis]|uniref:NupC/NupG family nucleoside CNT transporter n=1 Tax=Parabacteroides pacaensis TaxID=2086575 RepID=UPI000D10878C|nr:nucleoside transporter C-terminal domain-containing protein [Parabacteroides pacaensis]
MTFIHGGGFSWESLGRGMLGLFVVLAIAYALSNNRRRIDWKLVGGGLLMQILLALAVLYIPFIGQLFEWIGHIFLKIMDFTQDGMRFLLGPYADKTGSAGFVFLFHALPVVIFFSALVSLFYYWGVIQRIVIAFAWILKKFMKITGAEGLVVAGNIFMGMTESPVLIKNYLPHMNRSEIFLVMVAGMGTIAGSVMASYIGMLGSSDPESRLMFAKLLLSASVMAAPAAVVIAKIMCPQTEDVKDVATKVESRQYANALDALASGTTLGVKLMVNIAAMLLVFIAVVGLLNYITEDIIGRFTGLNDWVVEFTGGKAGGFTIQFILGFILSPLMWLIGVPTSDISLVGSLLGQKTILNEFVAYSQLQQWKDAGLFVYEKSVIMSTYILCGFANISSIGILLGGLGVLAPEKRKMITQMGVPSMIGGALVSILSATMIGLILG